MMMQHIELAASLRETTGTAGAKKVRAQGLIPAILYGPEQEPRAVTVETKAFEKTLRTEAGSNVIIHLIVKNNGQTETVPVLPHDIQRDVLSDRILHIDFYRVNLSKEIEAGVHVVFHGEAPAVKEGGVLVHDLREIQVKCLPTAIPSNLEVDLTQLLKIGDAVHVADLLLPPNVMVLSDPKAIVTHIAAPTKEEAPAEAAALAAEAPTQPERIGEKKEEEGKEVAGGKEGGKGKEEGKGKGKAESEKAQKK